jgi:DNA-binding NarL/FixJ family response regulator
MKILLVDDDADDCLLFCEGINLIDDTIECVIASNGTEVICSTSSDPIEIDDILDLDAGYITKPASFDLLVNSLRQFIIPLKIQLWINGLCPECFDSTNHSQSKFA